MKVETIAEFRRRGGIVKICRPAKAKGLEVRKYRAARHMNTRKPIEYKEAANEQSK